MLSGRQSGLYLRLAPSRHTLLAFPSPLHPFHKFHLLWLPQFISSTSLSPWTGSRNCLTSRWPQIDSQTAKPRRTPQNHQPRNSASTKELPRILNSVRCSAIAHANFATPLSAAAMSTSLLSRTPGRPLVRLSG